MPASTSLPEFEQTLREHLSAAHHLARWLTRTQADAEDVLQEAFLRAFRSFDRFRPDSPRAWLLPEVQPRRREGAFLPRPVGLPID